MNLCHICFLCDVTSSMGVYIERVKNDIIDFALNLRQDNHHIEFEFAFVGYRDWCDVEHFVILDFTSNEIIFENFVSKVKGIGGGDPPEDVLGGIKQSLSCKWNQNARLHVLFHILDSPPHNKKYYDDIKWKWNDDYPNGHPADPSHEYLMEQLTKNEIVYLISRNIAQVWMVQKMVDVFTQSKHDLQIIDIQDIKSLLWKLQEKISKLLLQKANEKNEEEKKEEDEEEEEKEGVIPQIIIQNMKLEQIKQKKTIFNICKYRFWYRWYRCSLLYTKL